jgi:ADP-ribosylglycohydrolase
MLGAVIGDIVGSVYEWNNVKAKDFGPLFDEKASYTDDTICTMAVAEALVNGRHAGEALKDWGRRYYENGGWGGMFSRWLLQHSLAPYNSCGNGAAMRVSPAGLLAGSTDEALALAKSVTEVTHNHPEGIKGAQATALAIFLARQGVSPQDIKATITEQFGYDLDRTVDDIRPTYRFDATCQGTVPQALVCALTATGFEDALRNAISIGGDSDTVAAIAGGLAEALFGIPEDLAAAGWSYLPQDMRDTLALLYEKAGVALPAPGRPDGPDRPAVNRKPAPSAAAPRPAPNS